MTHASRLAALACFLLRVHVSFSTSGVRVTVQSRRTVRTACDLSCLRLQVMNRYSEWPCIFFLLLNQLLNHNLCSVFLFIIGVGVTLNEYPAIPAGFWSGLQNLATESFFLKWAHKSHTPVLQITFSDPLFPGAQVLVICHSLGRG